MTVFLSLAVLVILLFMRDEVVLQARLDENRRAYLEARARVERGLDWESAWDGMNEGPSYVQAYFDLSKWTHAQFYPNKSTPLESESNE